MRVLDMQTYPRREYFKFFGDFNHPHFNMCANLDLFTFYPFLKKNNVSFTVGIIYLIARTANEIPEFRYRVRDGQIIEHEVVHPSATILVNKNLFSFCTIEYSKKFKEFAARASERIDFVKNNPTLHNELGQDNLLIMTAIPWVSFTSFMHPMHLHPADSVPRFAWGKFFNEGEHMKMPLSVQGHHAVMDGIHMGWFYEKIQDYLEEPEDALIK